jgi:hypothetical protein
LLPTRCRWQAVGHSVAELATSGQQCDKAQCTGM